MMISKSLLFFIVSTAFVFASTVRAQDTCPAGFTGNLCSVCTDDTACKTLTGSSEALCTNSLLYSNLTQVKSYSCMLTDPFLSGLIDPSTLLVQCFTGATKNSTTPGAAPPASPPLINIVPPAPAVETNSSTGRKLLQQQLFGSGSNSSPHCEISFKVQDPRLSVFCDAPKCGIPLESNASPIECKETTCSCVDSPNCGGNALINSIINAITGPTIIGCSENTNGTASCSLQMEGLPVGQIDALCSVSECRVPTAEPSFNGSDIATVSNLNSNPIIASIPSMILVLAVSFVGAYAFLHRSLWHTNLGAADSIALEMLAENSTFNNKRVQTLEFSNLCVSVPMGRRQVEKKKEALHTKALARAVTASAPVPTSGGGGSSAHGPGLLKAAKNRFGRKNSQDLEMQTDNRACSADFSAAEYVCGLHTTKSHLGDWYVLRHCTGVVPGGQFVGVLGPSGGGKTSLLGAIAGNALELGNNTILTGHVCVDGRARKQTDVAFVPQADLLIPSLTVAECLKYSALLRLPKNTSGEDIQMRIEMVLDELGLTHVAGSQVGGAGRIRGISGGERRRVTIGMELITGPGVLILDEPTSGLDSYTALNLMATLRSVAAHGRVVIASLHQPSGEMLRGLDQIALMGHGRLLYMGPVSEVDSYFESKGLPCPLGTPTAEHMLNVASTPKTVQMLLSDTHHKPAAVQGHAASSGHPSSDSEVSFPPSPRGGRPVMPGFSRQLTVLFWRTLVDIWRNPTLLRLHVIISAFMGIILGFVFWDLDNTNIGVQNRLGATFFALAFLGFTSLTTIDLLMNERSVVMREVRAGYYSPTAYLLSKVALDGLLLRMIPAIVYWAPFYYMAGFKTAAAYAATYVFVLVAFNCTVGVMSMCVTVASSTAGQASFLMNFLLLFSVLFTGFLVNVNSIPEWIRWIHYLSVFYYAFEAMVTSEILGGNYDFTADSLGANVKGVRGEVYLGDVLGFNTTSTTTDIVVLVCVWVGLILLALSIFLFRLPRTSDGRTWWKRLSKKGVDHEEKGLHKQR